MGLSQEQLADVENKISWVVISTNMITDGAIFLLSSATAAFLFCKYLQVRKQTGHESSRRHEFRATICLQLILMILAYMLWSIKNIYCFSQHENQLYKIHTEWVLMFENLACQLFMMQHALFVG